MLLTQAELQNNIESYERYSVALQAIEKGDMLTGTASLKTLLADYPTQAGFAQFILEHISQQASHVIHLHDK
jgi:hypothetical protein